MIEKKFVRVGRSWGIIIPSFIFKLFKIDPEKDKLTLTVENGKIILEKK